MRTRLAQFLFAELLAFGAFVTGGLALMGGVVTWSGSSRHPQWLSWGLVTLFAGVGVALGFLAASRFKRVLVRAS